jgi:glycyl-tRNA synthetase
MSYRFDSEFTLAEIEHFVLPDQKNHPKFSTVKDTRIRFFPRENQLGNGEMIVATIGEMVAKVFFSFSFFLSFFLSFSLSLSLSLFLSFFFFFFFSFSFSFSLSFSTITSNHHQNFVFSFDDSQSSTCSVKFQFPHFSHLYCSEYFCRKWSTTKHSVILLLVFIFSS